MKLADIKPGIYIEHATDKYFYIFYIVKMNKAGAKAIEIGIYKGRVNLHINVLKKSKEITGISLNLANHKVISAILDEEDD